MNRLNNNEKQLFEKCRKLYESKNYKLIGKYYPNSEPYQFNAYHCVYTLTDPETKIQYVYEDLKYSELILKNNPFIIK